MTRLLLCTDLDRTLLPNGAQPESPQARQRFGRLSERADVSLVYVTGRHRALIERAILSYRIPRPAFVISDAGTRIYDLQNGDWRLLQEWVERIDQDFAGRHRRALYAELSDLPALRLQERSRQNAHKLSYYVPLQEDRAQLCEAAQLRLRSLGVRADLIWSVDEPNGVGLLDVLPASAGKLEAILFLSQVRGFRADEVLFAGDSGNDLAVLASELPAVLVANAAESVRVAALSVAAANGTTPYLYLARGGFWDMNGNYSAGILEGVAHFRPDLLSGLVAERDLQRVG